MHLARQQPGRARQFFVWLILVPLPATAGASKNAHLPTAYLSACPWFLSLEGVPFFFLRGSARQGRAGDKKIRPKHNSLFFSNGKEGKRRVLSLEGSSSTRRGFHAPLLKQAQKKTTRARTYTETKTHRRTSATHGISRGSSCDDPSSTNLAGRATA